MASQGPRYAGTLATLAEASTSENAEAWVSPSNAGADDGTSTSITAATYDSPDISQLLVASNFGFTIPTGATIDGIVVEIDRNNAAGAASDNRVQLAKGTTFASLVGNNKADTATDWPASLASVSYGTGTTDLWGTTWTPAEVNASSFAVFLSVQADAANTDVAVDYIRVTVHYTYTPTADNSYETAIFTDSPVAVWSMEESSGNITDLMAGKVGTANGTPTYSETGPITGKTAISFDNIADYFSVPDSSDLDLGNGPFTIEFWMRRDADNGSQQGVVRKGTNAFAVNVRGSNDRIALAMQGVGFIVTGDAAVPVEATWHHYAITYNGTTTGIWYTDGVAGTVQDTSRTLQNTATALEIGKDDATLGGALAYLAIYNTVLSSTRIAAHFAAADPGTSADAGNAAATAAAYGATTEIDASAGSAAATAAANQAAPKVSPNAGSAAATAAAYGPTATVQAGIGVAAGVAAAYAVSAAIQATAGSAAASAAAYDATVSTASSTNAQAEVAAATAAAYGATTEIDISVGVAAATAAAYDATVSTAVDTNADAGLAEATAAAHQAAASVSAGAGSAAAAGAAYAAAASLAPTAGSASALAEGHGPAISIHAAAGVAAAVAAAYDATVSVQSATSADAGHAAAVAAAHNPTVLIRVSAEVAAATGSAYTASVQVIYVGAQVPYAILTLDGKPFAILTLAEGPSATLTLVQIPTGELTQ